MDLKDFMKNYNQLKEEERDAVAATSMKRGLNAVSNAPVAVHEIDEEAGLDEDDVDEVEAQMMDRTLRSVQASQDGILKDAGPIDVQLQADEAGGSKKIRYEE